MGKPTMAEAADALAKNPEFAKTVERLGTYSCAIVQVRMLEPETETRRLVLDYLEAAERRVLDGHIRPEYQQFLLDASRRTAERNTR